MQLIKMIRNTYSPEASSIFLENLSRIRLPSRAAMRLLDLLADLERWRAAIAVIAADVAAAVGLASVDIKGPD